MHRFFICRVRSEMSLGTSHSGSLDIFPFKPGNRRWMLEVLKAYCAHLLITLIFSVAFYLAESQELPPEAEDEDSGPDKFEEALWLCFCVAHHMSFGEFLPQLKAGRAIICILAFEAYWFNIVAMCIVLLSQLAGERQTPTAIGVMSRIVRLAWPSFVVYYGFVIILGIAIASELLGSHGDRGTSVENSVYFMWTVSHKISFGDHLVVTTAGRFATGLMETIGWLHMLYCLALLGLRRVSQKEHYELLGTLNSNPLETALLGAGYHVTASSPTDVEMVQVTPASVCT